MARLRGGGFRFVPRARGRGIFWWRFVKNLVSQTKQKHFSSPKGKIPHTTNNEVSRGAVSHAKNISQKARPAAPETQALEHRPQGRTQKKESGLAWHVRRLTTSLHTLPHDQKVTRWAVWEVAGMVRTAIIKGVSWPSLWVAPWVWVGDRPHPRVEKKLLYPTQSAPLFLVASCCTHTHHLANASTLYMLLLQRNALTLACPPHRGRHASQTPGISMVKGFPMRSGAMSNTGRGTL